MKPVMKEEALHSGKENRKRVTENLVELMKKHCE